MSRDQWKKLRANGRQVDIDASQSGGATSKCPVLSLSTHLNSMGPETSTVNFALKRFERF